MNYMRIDQIYLQRVNFCMFVHDSISGSNRVKFMNNFVNLLLPKILYHVTSCVIDNNTHTHIYNHS